MIYNNEREITPILTAMLLLSVDEVLVVLTCMYFFVKVCLS